MTNLIGHNLTVISIETIPELSELYASAHTVTIPTRTRFRGITEREIMLFEAPNGWTEFSPFPEYNAEEASAWLAAAIDYGWGVLSAPKTQEIPVNATAPALTPAEIPSLLERFGAVHTVKVKVAEPGQSLADDVARVRAVRECLGDTAKLRIDANGGWTLTQAISALTELADFDLDYAEQPVASTVDLARLRETLQNAKIPVKIAADESVRKATDPLEVARLGAADLLVIKAQPLGGVHAALDIIQQAGMPVVVSSALDTSIGISMGAHLAASIPETQVYGAHGLGTVALLDGDVTDASILPENGMISVHRPYVSEHLLNKFAMPLERQERWLKRLREAHSCLTDTRKLS